MFAADGKKGAQNKRGGIATAFNKGSLIFAVLSWFQDNPEN